VASLTTGMLTAQTEEVVAAVVFVDRQPVDGMALRGGRRVTGADALDEIADVPMERLSFRELPPDLAAVLGSYFLPTELREVPAARVVPEAFVRSLARPDSRGCVLVRAGSETGLVFLAAGQVVLALRPDAGQIGGLGEVADLLADPQARLWARLAALPEDFLRPGEGTRSPAAGPASVSSPVAAAPEPPAGPPLGPPPPTPGQPAPTSMEQVVEQIVQGARRRLGRHASAVEEVFRRAPPTGDGLRSAAESVRGLRIRLVSPATMEGIADDAIAILDRRM
jgi:hypothetical protein